MEWIGGFSALNMSAAKFKEVLIVVGKCSVLFRLRSLPKSLFNGWF
jgi:hypothetical protein